MTKNDEIKLLACPFCGRKAKIRNNCGIYQIYCIKCLIGTEYWEEHNPKNKKRILRINAWNKRCPTPSAESKMDKKQFSKELFNSLGGCIIKETTGETIYDKWFTESKMELDEKAIKRSYSIILAFEKGEI